GLPFEVLVAGIGNLATRNLTRYERAIQFHTEPLAKFTIIRQCTPDARNRRLEFNALLNPVIHFEQPPGCILPQAGRKGNLSVALCRAAWRRCSESAVTLRSLSCTAEVSGIGQMRDGNKQRWRAPEAWRIAADQAKVSS